MSKKITRTPLAAAIGAAIITSLSGIPAANADSNPFAANQLSSGYMVADNHMNEMGEAEGGMKEMGEGKCGEGKCGADKKAGKEGKCGEGNCGADKKAGKEGKCGEGKCGADKKMGKEGKCGEGKCGADKKAKEVMDGGNM